jgi:hypothetical protein
MSHRSGETEDEYGSAFDAPSLQPQIAPQPAYQPAPAVPAAQPSALRSSLLKKPLDAALGANPPNMPRFNR